MKRAHKYGARATTLDGVRFASGAEAARYAELLLMQRAGEIASLRCQPEYVIFDVAGCMITYVADFEYFDKRDSQLTAEDVKGHATEAYRLKRKMMIAARPSVALYEVTRGHRRRVYVTAGGVCRTREER